MKVGSLVELTDDNWPYNYGETHPVKNKIYTIRDIFHADAGYVLRLEEIVNKPQYYSDGYIECYFLVRRFRELLPPIEISIESFLELKTV